MRLAQETQILVSTAEQDTSGLVLTHARFALAREEKTLTPLIKMVLLPKLRRLPAQQHAPKTLAAKPATLMEQLA